MMFSPLSISSICFMNCAFFFCSPELILSYHVLETAPHQTDRRHFFQDKWHVFVFLFREYLRLVGGSPSSQLSIEDSLFL